MKAKNKIKKVPSFKLYSPVKDKIYETNTSNSKKESKKIKEININEEQKKSSKKINNDNIKKFRQFPLNNCIFNYKYISSEEKNKIFRTEKLLKKIKNSFEEKEKRKVSIDIPLNLSNKIPRIKLSLSKRKINKLSLSILSVNSINSKIYFNHKKNHNEKYIDRLEKVDTLTMSSYKKSSSSKNIKDNIKNIKNILNKKSSKLLTESNTINYKNKKSHSNMFHKYTISRNDIKKITFKNNSYDGLKKIISKIKNINLNLQNNEKSIYIKVNRIGGNQEKQIISDINYTIYNKPKNESYKNINKKLQKNYNQKVIRNNNDDYYLYKFIQNNQGTKSMRNIFDINKNENNNIFLDKNYQNRFNKKPKYTKINNEIFTNEKQKEYNIIIVKKKSNSSLNNLVTISTTNSSNSSNNNTTSNHKGNWVHRLYDEEINKQKMRDKMVYLLRKSILNDASTYKPRKDINRVKEYYYKNNFDENFNIINLFLSDDKKLKNKRIKKYNNFQCKSENNNKNNENDNYKTVKEKIRIIRKRRKNIKSKKSLQNFFFMYNEGLINEEDEEKEKDGDE